MRLLLDTHTLIWAAQEPELLPEIARAAIEDTRHVIYASAASAWEIATKFRLGKLAMSPSLAKHFVREVERLGFEILAISAEHAQRGGLIDIDHKDPFDRLLIAQAQIERMTLVSNEQLFDTWNVSRLWLKPLFKE